MARLFKWNDNQVVYGFESRYLHEFLTNNNMPEKIKPTRRIVRKNANGDQFSKIDAWISDDEWNALEAYCKENDRKRAPAIKILLRKSLELEGFMKGVK